MKVTLLAGGTGGAKMAHGFQHVLEPGELTVIVNVADDAEIHGLHVSPDLDTVLYTLAGLANPDTGWGVAGDTWTAMDMLARLGEPTWFRVGDADLATNLWRTRLLREGATLTDVSTALATALGVPSHVLPATDGRLRTILQTDAGDLEFQDYFVRLRQEPAVHGLRLDGLDTARPTEAVLDAIRSAELLVLAPSNPIVSIGPILALPGVPRAIEATAVAGIPRLAVSPIIAGQALKGPADRMLTSLGHESSALGVARIYAGLVDTFVLDEADADLGAAVQSLGMRALVLRTVMRTDADRAALARALLPA
ncbi:MAG TPA: 2-phospho-L-lactate transferase [Candidatus Limnocylindria bacterium]|nr:2-phospho-L-lactate transferase [Candidatus Limnocylindria bacterium]